MDPIVDYRSAAPASVAISRFMSRVYGWMTFGLLITAVVSYVIGHDEMLMRTLLGSGLGTLCIILQFGLVLGMSFGLRKMSVGVATFCFLLFSFTMGVTASAIFLMYSIDTIGQVFAITAAMFGGLALYGYTTKRDLTAFGSAMIAGLWGVIIAMIVNYFLKSPALDYALCLIGVIVFSGLIAWDTQKMKTFARMGDTESDFGHKFAIMGALALYLDFLNLFLSLLRVLGGGRRRG